MLETGVWLISAVVIAALVFDFTNGWNDSANAIATVVSTRVLSPMQAVFLAAVLNIAGAFTSTAVAKTIGGGIVDPHAVTQVTVLAALLAGIAWNTVMTMIGMPISASHALIGGLVGATVATSGWSPVKFGGLGVVLLAMLVSPFLGGLFGHLVMRLLNALFGGSSPEFVNRFFRRAQLVSVAFVAFAHGSGDAQKVMGIITLALFAGHYIPDINVPLWVVAASATAIGLGTAIGGWGVIKTLGMKMLHLKPIHGFAAETGAAAYLMTAAVVGLPVSSTHTITGAILGVGTAGQAKRIQWRVANKILYAWVFTLPASAVAAYCVAAVLKLWL
ncbi:MAG: anion permease [Mycobacterium leprae]